MKIAVLSVLALFLAGCGSEPFIRPPMPELKNPVPLTMRDEFSHTLADQFTTEDSVILHAPFHDDIAFLGVTRVDRNAGTFDLVGMNQIGVQFFALHGDRQHTEIVQAIGPIMKHKDILLSIGDSLRHAYFDLLPSNDWETDIETTYVNFEGPDKLVYEFGDHPTVLLEKRLEGFPFDPYRVQYFDYARSGNFLYPRGIVVDNGNYHYRMIIKNREWEKE